MRIQVWVGAVGLAAGLLMGCSGAENGAGVGESAGASSEALSLTETMTIGGDTFPIESFAFLSPPPPSPGPLPVAVLPSGTVPPTPFKHAVTVKAVPGAWTPHIVEDVAKGTVLPSTEITLAGGPDFSIRYTFGLVTIESASVSPPTTSVPEVTFTFDYKTIAIQR
jgi:hypothetical protein